MVAFHYRLYHDCHGVWNLTFLNSDFLSCSFGDFSGCVNFYSSVNDDGGGSIYAECFFVHGQSAFHFLDRSCSGGTGKLLLGNVLS